MAFQLLLVIAAVAFAAYFCTSLTRSRFRNPNNLPLPPGPPGELVVGHLRIVPVDNPEYAYAKWSQQYNSDVIHVSILGQPVIVLNSVSAAIELLDKRGANYCDRPRFVLFEVMGWQATLTFLR